MQRAERCDRSFDRRGTRQSRIHSLARTNGKEHGYSLSGFNSLHTYLVYTLWQNGNM